MSENGFEERIDPSDSGVNLLVEHLIRYEFVSQMTASSGSPVYFDLGCGNGFGLKTLQYRVPSSVLYGSDISDEALARAQSYLGNDATVRLVQMDLAKSEAYRELEALLKAHEGSRRILVCFEVLEHLTDFNSLITFVDEQTKRGVEAFISVPNDAFWGVQNPFHKTLFGEEAVLELMQLFEIPPRLYKQYPTQGATILPNDDIDNIEEGQIVGELLPDFVDRRQKVSVPSHFILYLGPSAVRTHNFSARFVLFDAAAERQWVAQREADMLYYKQQVSRLTMKWEHIRQAVAGIHSELSQLKSDGLFRGEEPERLQGEWERLKHAVADLNADVSQQP